SCLAGLQAFGVGRELADLIFDEEAEWNSQKRSENTRRERVKRNIDGIVDGRASRPLGRNAEVSLARIGRRWNVQAEMRRLLPGDDLSVKLADGAAHPKLLEKPLAHGVRRV